MLQIVYEHTTAWPEQGLLELQLPPAAIQIAVSPDSARRCANGYLVSYVSMSLHASDPKLIIGSRPVWRLAMNLRLPGINDLATLGTIDVDAQTHQILPLTAEQIRAIQDKANVLHQFVNDPSNRRNPGGPPAPDRAGLRLAAARSNSMPRPGRVGASR